MSLHRDEPPRSGHDASLRHSAPDALCVNLRVTPEFASEVRQMSSQTGVHQDFMRLRTYVRPEEQSGTGSRVHLDPDNLISLVGSLNPEPSTPIL